ncbi:MAG: prepilin-type N-terminal cleavage/methylation domain-containing protein [Steroidobacteraceae bacterium]
MPARRVPVRLASGFTLLELLVVLAIMLMMAAAFPLAFDRALPGRRVTIATEHLVAAIREAQTRSISQGKPIRVRLASLTDSLSASTHLTFRDSNGRVLSALTLYPDGSATGGQLRVVDGSHRSTVVVSAITGSTRVDGL